MMIPASEGACRKGPWLIAISGKPSAGWLDAFCGAAACELWIQRDAASDMNPVTRRRLLTLCCFNRRLDGRGRLVFRSGTGGRKKGRMRERCFPVEARERVYRVCNLLVM